MTAAQHFPRKPLWMAQMPFHEDGTPVIQRLLVANRGEIACRVMKTCRRLGITSIAIFADEDSASQHITDADEAIGLGSMDRTSGNPFLDIGLLVDIARRTRADAIHPGYGYLSENSQFATAVRAAGLIFVGPSSAAMSTLGDKRQAKDYLATHEPSIPLIPGWTGSTGQDLDIKEAERQAEAIGFPIMIKASAGGGGKGMRIVHEPSSFKTELERAQSEAQRSFGSGECILEKYIEAGKHVEVQIMGDSHGNVLSLWERDCSVQRRHQKVIEESPCSWLEQQQREEICAAAVRIGRMLGYENAGTVEFIVDVATRKFYFLEVNARLQVEHPITEECTGLDLVSLQLFVASGGRLSSISRLSNITQNGHAIECRLCAEDPVRDFAPQHGSIHLWAPSSPASRDYVRFETALGNGAQVSIFFDSMIAKIVVWAPNRSMAIDRMIKTLASSACIGPRTNQLFLQACLSHEGFHKLDYTTSFIPENLETLLQNPHEKSLGMSLSSLSVIPSLFLRELPPRGIVRRERQVFGSIPRGFRNQKYDRVNRPCDIVTTYNANSGSDINPQVCFWDVVSHKSVSAGYTAQIAPLEILDQEADDSQQSISGQDIVSKAYNILSASIRSGTLADSKSLDVKVRKLKASSTGKWATAEFDIGIDGQSFRAYVVSDAIDNERDRGASTKVFVHLPRLGAPIEYHCYSTLSYFESLRHTMADGKEAGSKTIIAPMPCKILSVLKKNGDTVKVGEVVMIVESMKMEMTISAGREGKFETSVKEGDAVDEGVVLCTLN